jgi:hypothetical protein
MGPKSGQFWEKRILLLKVFIYVEWIQENKDVALSACMCSFFYKDPPSQCYPSTLLDTLIKRDYQTRDSQVSEIQQFKLNECKSNKHESAICDKCRSLIIMLYTARNCANDFFVTMDSINRHHQSPPCTRHQNHRRQHSGKLIT